MRYAARIMLTDESWQKIARLYSSREFSITQLAKRFGVTYEAIRLGLRKRKLLPQKELAKCGHNASAN